MEWYATGFGSSRSDFALRLDVLVGPTPRDRSDRRAQMAMVGHPQGSNRCPLSEGLDDRGIAVNERRMGAEADWVRPRVTGRRSHRSPEGPPAEPFTVEAIPSGSRSISRISGHGTYRHLTREIGGLTRRGSRTNPIPTIPSHGYPMPYAVASQASASSDERTFRPGRIPLTKPSPRPCVGPRGGLTGGGRPCSNPKKKPGEIPTA